MPCRVHKQGDDFTVVGAGIVTAKELREAVEVLTQEPAPSAGTRILADLSDATLLDLSNVEVRDLASQVRARSRCHVHVAVVAPADQVYGMTRMTQTLLETAPLEIAVFRQRPDADTWLAGA